MFIRNAESFIVARRINTALISPLPTKSSPSTRPRISGPETARRKFTDEQMLTQWPMTTILLGEILPFGNIIYTGKQARKCFFPKMRHFWTAKNGCYPRKNRVIFRFNVFKFPKNILDASTLFQKSFLLIAVINIGLNYKY